MYLFTTSQVEINLIKREEGRRIKSEQRTERSIISSKQWAVSLDTDYINRTLSPENCTLLAFPRFYSEKSVSIATIS